MLFLKKVSLLPNQFHKMSKWHLWHQIFLRHESTRNFGRHNLFLSWNCAQSALYDWHERYIFLITLVIHRQQKNSVQSWYSVFLYSDTEGLCWTVVWGISLLSSFELVTGLEGKLNLLFLFIDSFEEGGGLCSNCGCNQTWITSIEWHVSCHYPAFYCEISWPRVVECTHSLCFASLFANPTAVSSDCIFWWLSHFHACLLQKTDPGGNSNRWLQDIFLPCKPYNWTIQFYFS